MFHEACKTTHPKLLAGTCPWCGSFIVEGKVSVRGVGDLVAEEYVVEGQTLTQVVESNGPLVSETAARYTHRVADCLSGMHAQKFVHRSIQPRNIMLSDDGGITILDSSPIQPHGISVVASADEDVSSSADYLAPEQVLIGTSVDARADIYSLGCTLYYLLCGRPPFPDGSVPQRLLKHLTEEPQRISEIRPDVSQGVIEICVRMMAERPEDRFQTAEEVATALKNWLAQDG